MDRHIREIQRRILAGDPFATKELDNELKKRGYIVIGYTDNYGASPGEAVYLVPITDSLFSIASRKANGQVTFFVEEIDEPGEHIGEYLFGEAEELANNYLASVQAEWVLETACENCGAIDRTILLELLPDTSPPWEISTDTLYLKCVECGEEWVDYSA